MMNPWGPDDNSTMVCDFGQSKNFTAQVHCPGLITGTQKISIACIYSFVFLLGLILHLIACRTRHLLEEEPGAGLTYIKPGDTTPSSINQS